MRDHLPGFIAPPRAVHGALPAHAAREAVKAGSPVGLEPEVDPGRCCELQRAQLTVRAAPHDHERGAEAPAPRSPRSAARWSRSGRGRRPGRPRARRSRPSGAGPARSGHSRREPGNRLAADDIPVLGQDRMPAAVDVAAVLGAGLEGGLHVGAVPLAVQEGVSVLEDLRRAVGQGGEDQVLVAVTAGGLVVEPVDGQLDRGLGAELVVVDPVGDAAQAGQDQQPGPARLPRCSRCSLLRTLRGRGKM